MAYISKERVSEIRKELKATFPEYKLSITTDYSTISIAILEAPHPLASKDYEQINIYYLDRIEDTEKRTVLEIIKNIANKGVKYYETGDYGTQPSHYTSITIGQWNRPFMMTIKNNKGKSIAGIRIKKVKETIS